MDAVEALSIYVQLNSLPRPASYAVSCSKHFEPNRLGTKGHFVKYIIFSSINSSANRCLKLSS